MMICIGIRVSIGKEEGSAMEDAFQASPEDSYSRFVEIWGEGGRFGKRFNFDRQSATAITLLFRPVAVWRHRLSFNGFSSLLLLR